MANQTSKSRGDGKTYERRLGWTDIQKSPFLMTTRSRPRWQLASGRERCGLRGAAAFHALDVGRDVMGAIHESLDMRAAVRRGVNLVSLEEMCRSCGDEDGRQRVQVGGEASG